MSLATRHSRVFAVLFSGALVPAAMAGCSGDTLSSPRPGTGGAGADAADADAAAPDAALDSNEAEAEGAAEASPDGSGPCSLLGEAACNAAQAEYQCTAYYGWKVPTGPKQFVACDEYCVGGAVTSCGVSPSGECWKFPDTCAPSGWTKVFECLLNAPPSCAGALDGGSGV